MKISQYQVIKYQYLNLNTILLSCTNTAFCNDLKTSPVHKYIIDDPYQHCFILILALCTFNVTLHWANYPRYNNFALNKFQCRKRAIFLKCRDVFIYFQSRGLNSQLRSKNFVRQNFMQRVGLCAAFLSNFHSHAETIQ